MHGGPLIEGLEAAAGGIAIPKAAAHGAENVGISADRLAHDEWLRIGDGLANPFAPGRLAGAGVAGAGFQDDQIPREQRTMRAAEIQQHAVVTRHRHHAHFRYRGCHAGSLRSSTRWMSPTTNR